MRDLLFIEYPTSLLTHEQGEVLQKKIQQEKSDKWVILSINDTHTFPYYQIIPYNVIKIYRVKDIIRMIDNRDIDIKWNTYKKFEVRGQTNYENN